MWKEGGWTRHAKLNPPPDFRLARIISETQFNLNYGSKDDLFITLQTQIMWLKTSYFNIKIFLSHIYSLSRTFGVLVVYFEILYSAFIITFPRKTIVRYLQQAWRYCSALRLCCLKCPMAGMSVKPRSLELPRQKAILWLSGGLRFPYHQLIVIESATAEEPCI